MASTTSTSRKRKRIDLGSHQVPSSTSKQCNDDTTESLTWRSNPETNFSDWTIIVNSSSKSQVDNDGNDNDEKKQGDLNHQRKEEFEGAYKTIDTYHVHKAVIGLGQRGFRSNAGLHLKESQSSTSILSLDSSEAKAFPFMLDFMYTNPLSKNCDVKATSDIAVALRHLANYFGVPTLYDNVTEFIEHDLNLSNIQVYIEEAMKYHDDTILDGAISLIVENWNEVLVVVSEHGTSFEIPSYIQMLPSDKQLTIFQQALFQTIPLQDEIRRFKRWTDGSRGSGDAPDRTLPKLGDRSSYGRYTYLESDGIISLFPLYYYDHSS